MWWPDVDVIVTYDVATIDRAGERRLARVAAVCERYGHRVQYSVFECRLDAILYERLVSELLAEIEVDVDSVNLYRLTGSVDSARQSLGRAGLDWSQAVVV